MTEYSAIASWLMSLPKPERRQWLGDLHVPGRQLGSNSKIRVQFASRPWVTQGYGGTTYTIVTGFQCAWDDAVNQRTTVRVL
ncbi:hypothetical protein ABZ807_18220 [Micromonospora sp. NPDC047548]|uniref:hypothetical protein n=1 Tax=Micromonospora sp. NPDC047548 TaxID=3155624 RepID=UPI0033EDFE86